MKTSASQNNAPPSSPLVFEGAVHRRSGVVSPIDGGILYRYRGGVWPEENLGVISTRITRDFAKRLYSSTVLVDVRQMRL